PEVCWNSYALIQTEGQGRPGARCTRGPMRHVHKECANEHTGPAESIRPSLRNGFTAYNVLSPENGSFASVAPRETVASRCIDPSTATSGPHAFAVRVNCARQSQLPRPPHPRPTFVTIASAPLAGTGYMRCSPDLAFCKSEIFLIPR